MKTIIRSKTETLLWTILLAIAVFSFCSCTVKAENTQGYAIDLPEEIQAATSNDTLRATVDRENHIVHVFFDNRK